MSSIVGLEVGEGPVDMGIIREVITTVHIIDGAGVEECTALLSVSIKVCWHGQSNPGMSQR